MTIAVSPEVSGAVEAYINISSINVRLSAVEALLLNV